MTLDRRSILEESRSEDTVRGRRVSPVGHKSIRLRREYRHELVQAQKDHSECLCREETGVMSAKGLKFKDSSWSHDLVGKGYKDHVELGD